MAGWSFLTNHARVLVCIAHDPGVRLRDIATTLDITERSAYSIVADLTTGGYVVKDKDGRRNRYQIQPHLRLPEAITEERTIGEVLDVLVQSSLPDHDELTGKRDASTPHATDDRTRPSSPCGAGIVLTADVGVGRDGTAVRWWCFPTWE